MLHHFPVTLLQKREIAENTVEMVFRVSDPNFIFKPGQYVTVELPSLVEAAITDRYHDFSIASSPRDPQNIALSFRVSQSPFKSSILSLPVGGVVNIDGPKGIFTLPETTETQLVFIAGGVGITPFLSQIRYVVETASPQEITLLYCNSKESTAAYRDELQELALQNPHISIVELWGLPREELFAPYATKFRNAEWRIVGAPLMVEKVQEILRGFGIMDKQVRTEEFSGYVLK